MSSGVFFCFLINEIKIVRKVKKHIFTVNISKITVFAYVLCSQDTNANIPATLFFIAQDLPKLVDGKYFSEKALKLSDFTFVFVDEAFPLIIDRFYCQVDTCVFYQMLFWCSKLICLKMLQVSCHSPVFCYLHFHRRCEAPLCCFRLLAWHSVTHHSVFSDPSGKMGSHPHFLVKLCLSSCTGSHVL